MKHLKTMIDSFVNKDFDNLILQSGYTCSHQILFYNNEQVLTIYGENVYISCNTSYDIIIDVLNSLDGITAVKTSFGDITINGIEWDYSKTCINIFK